MSNFQFEEKNVTKKTCGDLMNNKVCSALKLCDGYGEDDKREYTCSEFHARLANKRVHINRRPIVFCERCAACLEKFAGGQIDIEEQEEKLRKLLR